MERSGAEILLNPGTVLRLGDMSRLRMDDVKITDACVSLESGSAVVTVNYILKTDHVRVVAGDSVIVMKQAGVYRLDVTQGRLRVFSGLAEVAARRLRRYGHREARPSRGSSTTD